MILASVTVLGASAPGAVAQDEGPVSEADQPPAQQQASPPQGAATAEQVSLGDEGFGGAIGLFVDKFIGLRVATPTPWAFSWNAGSKNLRELRSTIAIRVVTTDRAVLTVSDADDVPSARGRIKTTAGLLGQPLRSVLTSRSPILSPQSLTAPVQRPLEVWDDAVTNEEAVVELRQKVRPGQAIASLRQKHIFVTISPQVP